MSLATIAAIAFCVAVNTGIASSAHTELEAEGPGGSGVWPSDSLTAYWALTGEDAVYLNTGVCPAVRDDLVLFYQYQLGAYPQIKGETVYYGGIPQLADRALHMARLEEHIRRAIPSASYDGLAIIDYESWHPLWDQTTQVYRDASLALARQLEPYRSEDALLKRAREQYETAAREFMVDTIRRAKQLRPHATWGYFGFPRIRTDPADLAWLFDECDAVFPVIYGDWASVPEPDPEQREADPRRFRTVIGRIMDGAQRGSDATGRHLPIIPFVSMRYRPKAPVIGGNFVNFRDLQMMLQRPVELGAAAVILWDDVDSAELADRYDEYLHGMLAPAMMTNEMANE